MRKINNVKKGNEKISNERDLFKFLNSIGVLRHLNKRKALVLLGKAKNIKLSVDTDGNSYTDHKKIVIGIPTNLLIGLSKKRVLLVLEGLTIHECYHNLRTVQSLWIDFIDKFGEYMSKEFNAPINFCKRIAKDLLNCVEDGRIERIASKENNYNSKCLALTNATFFNSKESIITKRGSFEEELECSIFNFLSYAKFGVPMRGYTGFYGHNMKYMNKAKKHIFKFVEEDSFKEAIPHLENAINECYDLFKDLFYKIDFNNVENSNQNEIGEGCGDDDGKSNNSSSSSSSSNSTSTSSTSNSTESTSSSNSNSSNNSQESKNDSYSESDKGNKNSKYDKSKNNEEENNGSNNNEEDNDDNKNKNEKGKGKSSKKNNEEKKKEENSSGDDSLNDDSKENEGNKDSKGNKDNKGQKEEGNEVDKGNEDENVTIKDKIQKAMDDIIMNNSEIDESKLTADISDVLKEIEDSLEVELEDSISSILETIEKENIIEEEKIRELKNEVDTMDMEEIFDTVGKAYSDWARFRLRYIYPKYDILNEAPKEYLKNSYRMREHFKKILEPQKKSISKNKRVGQIDRGSLWKYAVNDNKMFQRNNNPKNNDYAIYIMVDGSGSMASFKFEEAFLATTLLEDVLSDIVPLKIVMFNTDGACINHTIVKNFSDNKNGSYSYTFLQRNNANGANADGLSIRFATKELLKRNERDKMLIILSDGQPNSELDYHGKIALDDVKNAVSSAREKGIKVFNIMFGNEYQRESLKPAFKYMYEKGIVSCSPEKIAEELMRIVKLEIK